MSTTYDSFDVSDGLDVLMKQSRDVAYLFGADLSDMAAEGMKLLNDLATRLVSAERAEREELIAALMADASARQPLGAAHYSLAPDVDAALMKIGGIVKRDVVRALKQFMAREAATIEEQHGARERQTREATISAMLARSKLEDVPRGLRCPPGYDIDEDGVRLGKGEDAEVVALKPIIILGYSEDFTTKLISLRLAWMTAAGRWCVRDVPREIVADGRRVLALAAMGAPIHSGSGGNVARYLAAFEVANGGKLPARINTNRLGWHGDEFVPFTESVRYVPDEEFGESQLASAVTASGTLEGWIERLMAAPPLVQVVMLASACTPLLAPCEVPGFAVDLAGLSSTGKTVALLAAASVWGPPRSALLSTWESTKVNIMARAAVLHSIPVILDDTKHAQSDPTRISETLYCVPGGRERERGTKEGRMRIARTWRTCLISTGEQRITEFSNDLGTRGRVLSFFSSPFATPAHAVAFVDVIEDHYGVAGPAVVDWIRGFPKGALRDRHRALVDVLLAEAPEIGPLGRRLVPNVAMLLLAADALGVAAELNDAFAAAMGAATTVDKASDVHRRAFDDLVSWCVSSSTRFWDGATVSQPHEPMQGWLGMVYNGERLIAPRATVAQEQLERMGYRPAECYAVWAERGWLVKDGDRTTHNRRLNGFPVRVVLLRLDPEQGPLFTSEKPG